MRTIIFPANRLRPRHSAAVSRRVTRATAKAGGIMVGIWNHSLYDPTPPIAAGRTPPRLLCIGGEDHALRVPFLVALRKHGFCITAAGTGDQMPFRRADIAYHRYHFDRFDSRTAHRSE